MASRLEPLLVVKTQPLTLTETKGYTISPASSGKFSTF